MKSFLAIVGVAALLWMALRWLRLVWFRAKTLKVITQELLYSPSVPGLQSAAFNAVTRAARTNRWNEYDAAIAFMLVQLGALSTPLDEGARQFCIQKLRLLETIAPNSNAGNHLIEEFLANQRGS